jgi:ATP-dependent Clp protease ATP-binding subunit ClpA
VTGLPINSIVVMACLEWMERHPTENLAPAESTAFPGSMPRLAPRGAPRPGRRARWGFLPMSRFSQPAQRVFVRAQEVAHEQQRGYIGSDHLLVALAAENQALAACALNRCGLGEEQIREPLSNVISESRGRFGRLVPTSAVRQIVDTAVEESEAAQAGYVGTHHLLLGLARVESVAAKLLPELGAPEDRLREAVQACLQERGEEQ